MDITFISMHDLSPDANVLYASESIGDVLGYQPGEVEGKSCFEYFHPDESPFAAGVHRRAVSLDHAAMLSYCNLKRKDGTYVRCECVFTVVYSAVVACTSLYRHTDKSRGRALAAPAVRRAFTNATRDPRHHMLTHLSAKFTAPLPASLPDMGIDAGQEGRGRGRGGRHHHHQHHHHHHHQQQQQQHEPRAAIILNRFTRTLAIMYATHALDEILGLTAEEAVGKSFFECIDPDCLQDAVDVLERAKENDSIAYMRFRWRDPRQPRPRSAGGGGGAMVGGGSESETGSSPSGAATGSQSGEARQVAEGEESVQVEAVVSCTSDGLVVILRRAHGPRPVAPVFAAPWSYSPRVPEQPATTAATAPISAAAAAAAATTADATSATTSATTGAVSTSAAAAAANSDFMEAIRQVAVFAWSLRSINGEIMAHALPGRPSPDAAEAVGDFVAPGSAHWKRAREWGQTLERLHRGGDGGAGAAEADREADPQYSVAGKDADEVHSSKRRAP